MTADSIQRRVVWRARIGFQRIQADGVRLFRRHPHQATTSGVHAHDVVLCRAAAPQLRLVATELRKVSLSVLVRWTHLPPRVTLRWAISRAGPYRLCRFLSRLHRLRVSSLSRRLQLAHPVHDPLQFRRRLEPQVLQQVVLFLSRALRGSTRRSMDRLFPVSMYRETSSSPAPLLFLSLEFTPFLSRPSTPTGDRQSQGWLVTMLSTTMICVSSVLMLLQP